MQKNAIIVCTVACFLNFEINDIQILKDLGYQVHVATNFKNYEYMNEKLSFLEVVKHQVDFARSPYNKRNLIAYKQLKRILQEDSFELMHCHTPMGGCFGRMAARMYRKKGKMKVMYTAHGFHFYKGAPWLNWIIYYPVEKICSYMTDVLITINKEDFLLAQKRMRARKVEYIPGVGVDLQKFGTCNIDKNAKRRELGIPNDAFLLLSVGELSPRKNHHVVIRALGEIKNTNIYYMIAGKGTSEKEYLNLIKEIGMEKQVKLLGQRTDISELCQAADCFVHPSAREGLGMAPLEAMASGLPLISSDINGIKDYTENGKSGCCVEFSSVLGFKNAIMTMYSNEEFRAACGRNNLITVRNYDIKKTEKIMRNIYDQEQKFFRGGGEGY